MNYEDFSRPVETCTEILNYATNRNRNRNRNRNKTQDLSGNKIDDDVYLFQKNKIVSIYKIFDFYYFYRLIIN